ncbi:MAG: tetratricopeptide repeat protein [Candidatus Gastranaerophilales bacterium]|nr:tetratricopeptide repeat protein [Candidatus Gastranaerophilales bacterium]
MEEENKRYINNNKEAVLSNAQKQYAQGNYAEALKILLGTVNTSPDSEIYLEIGNCYYMLHQNEEALESWSKAIKLNPKNSRAYSNMGNLYYRDGQIEKAISLWLVALISRPEDANTSLNLAIAFNEKNMRFESIKYFEKYIKYAEDKTSQEYLKVKTKLVHCYNVANQYLTFGVQFQSENNDKKAAACYFKSLANYPNLSKTNLNLGSIFFADKNLDLAIKYWKTAMYIEPNYDKIYSNLAISYDLMKKFDYAYCYYDRYMNYVINNKEEYAKANRRLLKIKPYLNEHPELIPKHLALANTHLANSEFNEAIDEFKNYSILNPAEKQKYKDIIEKLESYLNPELSIIKSCFEIGNNLLTEGRFSEAKPYFWRIMKLSSPQYLEFTKARAKYAQCEKAEAEISV